MAFLAIGVGALVLSIGHSGLVPNALVTEWFVRK